LFTKNEGLIVFLKQALNDDELRSMVRSSYIELPFGDEYQVTFKVKKRRKTKPKLKKVDLDRLSFMKK